MAMTVFMLAAALGMGAVGGLPLGDPDKSHQAETVVAIDVLLHPDATMLAAAAAANLSLRQDYPAGFALDTLHTPHVSMIQRFVRRTDLEKLKKSLEKVFARTMLRN